MSEPTYPHATEGAARGRLRLLQLYPRDMNIYGDWGNALVLARRAQWAGYDVDLLSYDPGDELPEDVDLLVGGGGQDSGQERIKEDLTARGPQLRAWARDGMPMLVICGLYQLFGRRFVTGTGGQIPGISIFDAETVAGSGRLIGNITLESKSFGRIVGYENHSGLTTLAPGVAPFGRVRSGDGNNGRDGTEGARADHVIGTYLHGSLLPKNPAVADWLLARAVERAGGTWESERPGGLDERADAWAERARRVAASRPRRDRLGSAVPRPASFRFRAGRGLRDHRHLMTLEPSRIILARQRAGLPKTALARAAGVAPRTVTTWESRGAPHHG